MDQCQSRGKPLTNFQRHWSIRISLKTRQSGHWSIRISFRIFIFFVRGGGRGSPRRQEGGDRFSLKIFGGGGFPGGGGAERPGGCLQRIGEFLFVGGPIIFYWG